MNFKFTAVAALSLALTLLTPEVAHSEGGKTYRITITNLTAGQPITPPILVTHTSRTGIFTVGEAASEGIRQIAENGNGGPLLEALSDDSQVHEVVAGMAPLVPASDPGNTGFESSETFTITTHGRARYLSFASMLICTNDGFTGLDSIRLPNHKNTVYSASYDARTEMNTEDFADIVPPCQGLIGISSGDMGTGMSDSNLVEDGIVIPHAGVNGGVDLFPEVHGWGDPVTKIEIERVRHHYDD
ncbi:MAG: hypothetical protein HKO12_01565 [Woeseiaceae bacterium]|nr:hypothetical protein [Woeseiaceae bacterium]